MTCEAARELFSALVDAALTPDERRSLDAHLAGCVECRRELEAFQRTIALVRSAPALRAPAGFVERVLAAARPTPWYGRLARRLFVPVRVKVPIEALAVLVVAVVALQLYRETPELQRAARQEAQAPPASETLSKQETPASPATPPPAHDARDADAGNAPEPAKRRLASDDRAGANESPPARDDRHDERRAESDVKESENAASAMKDEARPARERALVGDPAQPRERLQAARPSEHQMEQGEAGKEPAPSGAKSAAPPPVAPSASASRAPASAPTAVDVAGRLAVSDRVTAETAVIDLVTRLGGVVIARRAEPEATIVDVRLPRGAYADLLEGLVRIGRWTVERESRELPEDVRLTLRLAS